jgi:hypothetical protein
MGVFNNLLSTEGVTKKDGEHVKNKKHVVGYTTNDFHNKVIEARIKQSNWRWIRKELIITIIGAFIVYYLLTSK